MVESSIQLERAALGCYFPGVDSPWGWLTGCQPHRGARLPPYVTFPSSPALRSQVSSENKTSKQLRAINEDVVLLPQLQSQTPFHFQHFPERKSGSWTASCFSCSTGENFSGPSWITSLCAPPSVHRSPAPRKVLSG